MALDFNAFVDELKGKILAVWPEVTEVIDAEHASRVPWTDLDLPFAVLLIETWPRCERYGMTWLAYEPDCWVYYVAETGGTATTLRTKLLDLINSLWPGQPLTTATVTGFGDISVGDDLPPNRIFVDANRAQRAGVVPVTCLVGIARDS